MNWYALVVVIFGACAVAYGVMTWQPRFFNAMLSRRYYCDRCRKEIAREEALRDSFRGGNISARM